MKVCFKKRYFTPFLLVLVAEIAIAIFYFHRFVRGFLGDVLVIPLLYYLLRSLFSLRHKPTLLMVLSLAFVIEGLQFLGLMNLLSMSHFLVPLVLGNTFDWLDVLAYALGGVVIYFIENSKQE